MVRRAVLLVVAALGVVWLPIGVLLAVGFGLLRSGGGPIPAWASMTEGLLWLSLLADGVFLIVVFRQLAPAQGSRAVTWESRESPALDPAVVAYLQNNRASYAMRDLVAKLREVGHSEWSIAAAVRAAGGDRAANEATSRAGPSSDPRG
jgi:hypothetical protein